MHINPINLKRAREAKGLSLERLAGKAQIDKQTIYRIEAEPPKKRRALTVKALADALGLTVTELCGPDLELEAKERAELRSEERSQMNVRVSDRIRNAYSLLGLRYGVSPSQVVQIAPFLFVWAAEMSLRQRKERLQRFRAAQEAMEETMPSYMKAPSVIDEDFIHLEECSIANRDILGLELENRIWDLAESEYDEWAVLLGHTMGTLVPQMPDDVVFGTWLINDEPDYEICRSDAVEWLGGDAEAAEHIVSGRVTVREVSALRISDGAARAAWVREEGERREVESQARLEELEKEQMRELMSHIAGEAS
jgi:transcriptional regulator with XRE-family HTH domain